MSKHFVGFSEEKQAEYEKYALEHWDKELVRQSSQRWAKMSRAEKDDLLAEGERITLEIADALPRGFSSPDVQQLAGQWHTYINNFYDCSLEIFLALGIMYNQNPDFMAFYQKIHPSLPEFLSNAIRHYCKERGVIE